MTTSVNPDPLWPSPVAPMAVARRLVAEQYATDEMTTLRRWRGGWMRWDADHWAEMEDAKIRAEVYAVLESAIYINARGDNAPWNPTDRRVSAVVDAVKAITHLSEQVDTPSWLDGYPAPEGIPANEVVACRNTLLHVTSRTMLALTPALFNRAAVPFDYEPDAPEPVEFLAFLRALWPDETESADLLAEYFGYVLSGRTDLQKILLMVGPKRSGKGTIARVLTALVGEVNRAAPTLSSLSTNFGLAPLLGKILAVVSDARQLVGKSTAQTLERLLTISGEDPVTVDRKNRDAWTGRLPSRFMIMSNQLPEFDDPSGAIASRFVVLAMTHSFIGREDHGLADRLTSELPGILRWSLDGLDRLLKTRRFTEPAASDETVSLLADASSGMSVFLRERCAVGPGSVRCDHLYRSWEDWCSRNHTEPGTLQQFGVRVNATVSVKVTQPRDEAGKQHRTYDGLRLLARDTDGHGQTRTVQDHFQYADQH